MSYWFWPIDIAKCDQVENMADADSLHDMSSDLDQDLSAVEADVDDDEVSEQRCLLFCC